MLLLLGALAAVLLAATLIGGWANRGGAGVERAHLLPDGTAVLVLRPVSLLGSEHRARVVAVDPATGAARAVVDDVGRFGHPLRVWGPSGGALWFAASPTTLWSRPVDAIATRREHDLSAHPTLSAGFEGRWTPPGGLIVRDRAGGEHLLTTEGDLVETEWSANSVAWHEWPVEREPYPAWRVSARLPSGAEVAGGALPVESGGLVVRPDRSLVLVNGGAAAVVLGGDLGVPPGYPRVDRIGAVAPGRALWSASAADLFGPPTRWDLWLEVLSIRVLAVEAVGERLVLVLRATDDDGGQELRFVTVDGASGAVVAAVGLAPL